MKIIIQRETLLEPLQLVAGVVEKRQVLPILSTVLLRVQPEQLLITGTNLEVEMIAKISLEANQVLIIGEIAVSASKLTDICRLLPEKAMLEISHEASQLTIKSGRSRFALSIFLAEDFPQIDEGTGFTNFSIPQNQLKKLIERTSFAMAEQDVRYFLNGLQIQISHTGIDSVAADGHRLAFGSLFETIDIAPTYAILPRKGVIELLRLLNNTEGEVLLGLSSQHLRVMTERYTFTSKLIDSVLVNYKMLVPENCDKSLVIERENLKQAINRIAILSTEKIRGVRFQLSLNTLKILASNMSQEYGEEEFTIDYQKSDLEISFSANYMLDVLSVIQSNTIELRFASAEQGFLVKEPNQEAFMYVIMPII